MTSAGGEYGRGMQTGRFRDGGAAGFLAAGVSGPLYVLVVLLIPFIGDPLDLDPEFGIDVVLAIPLAVVFGLVFAGLPSILTGMVLGVWVGDRAIDATVTAVTLVAGALGGWLLLASVDDADITIGVALLGATIGVCTAMVWLRLFDFLRSRSPTRFDFDSDR